VGISTLFFKELKKTINILAFSPALYTESSGFLWSGGHHLYKSTSGERTGRGGPALCRNAGWRYCLLQSASFVLDNLVSND
jgi:hypothetical protein